MQPVREAIRRLETIGLVEVVANRGARVRGVSIEDLRDTYVVRLHLETFAIRQAAERFTEEEWTDANQHLIDHDRLEFASQFEMTRAAHSAFHFTLYKASGSSWLPRSIQPLWENSERYRIRSLPRRGTRAERRAEHERILDACRRREPEEAASELERHLRRTANLVAGELGAPDLFE
jgi:DNA-binding GntR family transcriptional regulator